MPSVAAKRINSAFKRLGNPTIAAHSLRFFKTGKGEYGEGDRFLGIRVPVIRAQVKEFADISLDDVASLLKSDWHEIRLFALLLLVHKFDKGDGAQRRAIYQLYLRNTRFINNWDLVDTSAPQIVGAYLAGRDRKVLYKLARSKSLWERRIAVMACLYFIRDEQYDDVLALSELLLDDAEDLIHKATGWMLREVGKRNLSAEKAFLEKHHRTMPRTMLRYAIERLSDRDRKKYLRG